YEVERAHLIGMSLGGMIAQLAALQHPARVATLTLIASSVFGPDNPDLPPINGSAHPFDEPTIRPIATGEVKRAGNLVSMFNHALLTGGERWHGKVGEIHVPALVIHGTDDPVLPYPHGLALARAIPGAKLLTSKNS